MSLYRVVSIASSRTHWSDGSVTLCGIEHKHLSRATKQHIPGTDVQCRKCRLRMERGQ